ncbi:MAG: hypothetical protein EU535_01100 [Promethearchaeota archaeon]|nr:MAG: hypothetical protein EU535_01100 [Candidatus Lokiarchaeota archaeon]
MLESLDKNLMLNIFNSNEFKGWLTARRWFGDKAMLSNLAFEISFVYFEIIAERIFLTVIQVQTSEYSKSYFLPLIYYKKIQDILDPNEKDRSNIIKLTENTFSKKIVLNIKNIDKVFTLNLVEAEYCVFFWKKMLFDKHISEKFPSLSLDLTLYLDQFQDKTNMEKVQNLIEASLYPDRYSISMEQLGKGNTTNLLFKLDLLNKKTPEKEPISYVLKSYKEHLESLEPKTLYVLVENVYPNSPKIYGTIKVLQKETIGIIENVPNVGNVGDIYWSELNYMIEGIFSDIKKDYSDIDSNEYFSKLIKNYCYESLNVSVDISFRIRELHQALISQNIKEYQVEQVESKSYLKDYTEKLNTIISDIQKIISQESKDAFYNLPKVSSILIDIKDIVENFRLEFSEEFIKIQPVHQDLHMEQILYDKKNEHYQFCFIDFEGDPQLSVSEKKSKFPIEKDLASFLRALSYIKFNTLLGFIGKKVIDKRRYEVPEEILYNVFFRKTARPMNKILDIVLKLLNTWETKLMAKILKDPSIHFTLVTYFYIERALHELNYEILFRPSKIIVPILGLKEIVDKQ